jgi:hypothetical protein
MLENVKSFYAKGNSYEILFVVLTVGMTSFFIAFVISKIVGLWSNQIMGYFAPFMLFLGIVIATLTLAKKVFVVPRKSKLLLLASLSISLIILHTIL